MSTVLKDVKTKEVAVAEIIRTGERIILPSDVKLEVIIDLLQRRLKYESEIVMVIDKIPCFPWDGALALRRVLEKKFGWSAESGRSMTIECGYQQTVSVPWGAFSLPTLAGATINVGATYEDNQWYFFMRCDLVRAFESELRIIFELVREEIRTNSIYKGKAIKLHFSDEEAMPTPTFMNTKEINPDMLVFSDHIMEAIETNVFTPIKKVKELAANNLPFRRGVLFGGTFGTGKTLAASVAAYYCELNGITFIHCDKAEKLDAAISFGRQYQNPGCLIFCEDIDRSINGKRTIEMDSILNIIDGVDSKNTNIMIVLTTNDLKEINAAMLRPGRLDAVIDITPPDEKAVEKLIRNYGGSLISPDESLDNIRAKLAGNIPATIAEVVKRAKLSQLKLNPAGVPVNKLTEQALLDSANSMAYQLETLQNAINKKENEVSIEDILTQVMSKTLLKSAEEQFGEKMAEVACPNCHC